MVEQIKYGVKVAEYRSLTDRLSQAFASLKSAATREERAREAGWVRRAAADLTAAHCPRKSLADEERAERLIDITASYLIEAGLTR